MNFLEKQVDKANSAYQVVNKLDEQVVDQKERIDILELG
jgi:hypothetical protein